MCSNANIGVATGRRSGILVLDVDGKVGKASLEKLQAEHGRLPKTVTVKTGKGRHRYFLSDDARIRNSVGNLGKGIDVRADRGYVVAAGSGHVSGADYKFVDGRGLDEIDIAAAPEWLVGLLRKESSRLTRSRPTRPTSIRFQTPNMSRPAHMRTRPDGRSWIGSERRPSTSGTTP